MKTIGLIGGMSWESTAHYYSAINTRTAQRLGCLHSAPILIHSLDFAPVAEMQTAGEWDELGTMLAQSAKSLEAAGAQLLGLATNTMHMVADAITAATDLPFVHIAEPCASELVEDGYKTVGLLGTRYTLELPFYKNVLRAKGLEPVVPETDVTNLNGIIFEELCRGIVSEQSRQTYIKAIEHLQQRGAEAVILGCTELNMLIDDGVSPLPVYDTTELHTKALVEAALG